MKRYQIFISYRRDGGSELAGRLSDRLSARGYNVFFDVESMRSGAFNTQLLGAIDQCSDVLLVLPPHALDRCVDADDWVRQELAYALKKKKNIIPVLMRGFVFPDTLPADIAAVRMMEGVAASHDYFDAVVDRIASLLVAKKAPVRAVPTGGASQIKLPLFLKTPGSRLPVLAQPCMKAIREDHAMWVATAASIRARSLPDYLFDLEVTAHMSGVPYDAKAARLTHALHHDFKGTVGEMYRSLFTSVGIESESYIGGVVDKMDALRSYVEHLYQTRPFAYETTIVELLWFYFELEGKHSLLGNELYPALCHAIQMNSLLDARKEYKRVCFPGNTDKKKFNIFEEVSPSVQAIIDQHRFETDTMVRKLMVFLEMVITLFTLDGGTTSLLNKLKKYYLIQYKYVQTTVGNIHPDLETDFVVILQACDRMLQTRSQKL